MMVLPAAAQRWIAHHPVLPVAVFIAATVATAQAGGTVLAALVWLCTVFAAGVYIGFEHSILRRHDPQSCAWCDETVADRHAAVLRCYHRLTRPVVVVALLVMAVLVVATSMGVAWGWRLTGLVFPPAVWVWAAYGLRRYIQSTHIRLRPWCPWCTTPTRHAQARQTVS